MTEKKISLIEISKVFLTIGSMGFGGGMAIIALMQEFCVNRKKWLTIEEFSCAIAFGQCWGSRTVNISIFIGYQLRGLIGALVAVFFILTPSMTLVILLSALYVKFNEIPSFETVLKGIRPVVIALILSAAFKMCKGRIKNFESVFLIIMAIFLVVFLKFRAFVLIWLTILYGTIKYILWRRKLNENI